MASENKTDSYKQEERFAPLLDPTTNVISLVKLEGSQTFEWLSKRKNGECFYTEVVLTMSHYSGESRVLAVVRDISERKKSETDLARQAMLLELTKDSIFVRDMADKITYWNRGAEKNYGWTDKEAKGQVTHSLLKTVFPVPFNEIQDCLNSTDYWEGELKHTRKDGSQIIVTSRWTLIRDDKGEPNAVFEINSDITARKQSEIEITRLTAMLDESQHIAKVGGWEIDLITNTLYWSDETYRIHDTSPAEYTPTLETAIAFYDPESLPIINAAVKAAIEEDKEFNLEMKLITAKGRPILVNTTCKVIRENGTPIKILGAFKDITEQRRTEEKLRQSLKMESIGRLAGGVAHDFNNKLTVILGYAELLKLEFPDNQELLEKLREICTAAQHSRDITAQLLTFSRQQIISPRPICLNTTIKEMQRTLPRLIGEDISLSFALAENLQNVLMDPVQLDQIVMNLAGKRCRCHKSIKTAG